MKKFLMTSAFLVALPLALPMASYAQAGSAASALSAQDREFATTAAAAGMSEVQEGQLAASKGDSAVQKIGNRMVTDHTKANTQLQSIAATKGLTLPSALTAAQSDELAHLKGLSGGSRYCLSRGSASCP